MRTFFKILATSGCLLGMCVQAWADDAPRHIDVKRLSRTVEDVVVPLPNEIFAALNKLDSVNWKEFVRTDKGTNFTERPRIALGAPADLVLLDLERAWRVGDEPFRSRSGNSWCLGDALTGSVLLTLAGGAVAFERLAVTA